MTKDNLRKRVYAGVFHYPNDLDALLEEAAEVTGMNDPSVPQNAREFVKNQARMHGSEYHNVMLATFENYCNFAEEILKIVNAVHASYTQEQTDPLGVLGKIVPRKNERMAGRVFQYNPTTKEYSFQWYTWPGKAPCRGIHILHMEVFSNDYDLNLAVVSP